MPHVKVAVVGAGSYVFGPSMLKQALFDHRLEGLDLVLLDVDSESVEIMAACGRRLVREQSLSSTVTPTTDRSTALDGADFVIFCAARQGLKRFQMDLQVIQRLYPDHLVTEFGGVAGISYTLRQIGLISQTAGDMLRLCPSAWLMDSANPMPRLCQAAHELGVKTAGFCAVSIAGLGMAWEILHGEKIPYPYGPAQEAFDYLMGGLNHFAWLLELRDRQSGRDLIPTLGERLRQGHRGEHPRAEGLCLETGYLLVPGDDHTRDFLSPAPDGLSRTEPFHGNPEERRQRMAMLRDIAEGRRDTSGVTSRSCWERPIDLVAAVGYGKKGFLHALDLVNDRGQIPQLPRQVFVETPCDLMADGPAPRTIVLPESVLPYAQSAAAVTEAIVQAARHRSRKLLRQAVELDPTIVNKSAGWAAMQECLAAHADILPANS
jgi:alpha-galactosidase/6-phospho-beta-glucosidase family protein